MPSDNKPFDTFQTGYAGIRLLLFYFNEPKLVDEINRLKFDDDFKTTNMSLFLHLFLISVLSGYRRVWHINDLNDPGIKLFLGTINILEQSTISRMVNSVKNIDTIVNNWAKNNVLKHKGTDRIKLSTDGHAVPYWGKEKSGYTKIPTRGRVLKSIKIFSVYELEDGKVIDFIVSRGNKRLSQYILKITNRIIKNFGEKRKILLLFDKGGYKYSDLNELNKLTNVRYITPAKNTKSNIRQWDSIDRNKYKEYIDPRDGEKSQIVITKTKVKYCEKPLRTILLKNDDSYSGFFTSYQRLAGTSVIDLYRTHWKQENYHRDVKNFLGIDYTPKKMKKNKVRKSFNRKPISLVFKYYI